MRSNPTDAELTLWQALQSYRPRFTRQLKVGPYTLDLASRRARLAVEIDGSQHANNLYDDHRTAALEALGWAVIRFWNNDVLSNVDGVVEAIVLAGNLRLPPGEAFEATESRAGRERRPRTRGEK